MLTDQERELLAQVIDNAQIKGVQVAAMLLQIYNKLIIQRIDIPQSSEPVQIEQIESK